jgi:hypothetical protein
MHYARDMLTHLNAVATPKPENRAGMHTSELENT